MCRRKGINFSLFVYLMNFVQTTHNNHRSNITYSSLFRIYGTVSKVQVDIRQSVSMQSPGNIRVAIIIRNSPPKIQGIQKNNSLKRAPFAKIKTSYCWIQFQAE
jgi:hypothetical protein